MCVYVSQKFCVLYFLPFTLNWQFTFLVFTVCCPYTLFTHFILCSIPTGVILLLTPHRVQNGKEETRQFRRASKLYLCVYSHCTSLCLFSPISSARVCVLFPQFTAALSLYISRILGLLFTTLAAHVFARDIVARSKQLAAKNFAVILCKQYREQNGKE